MNIVISAESTIDLPTEILEQYHIRTVPFSIVMGEKSYLDGVVLSKDLFEFTEKTGKLPKTSAVNEFQYRKHFQKLFDEGYEGIIHFSLSSELSCAYQNALKVSKDFENVYVIDSRTLSTGIALQAIYASKLAESGVRISEIVDRVKSRIPFDQASFSLESVNYLYKGGRCSMLAHIGANLLHLKPVIIVKNGKMVAGKKFIGNMKKVVLQYVDEILKSFDNPDHGLVFITYSSAPEEVLQAAKSRLLEVGFKNVIPTLAGGTISCHCGPHCLGILYFNDGDNH
ncbi:MAG: DegV family protein [Bacilli bacterium]